jgi:hypothetical protein
MEKKLGFRSNGIRFPYNESKIFGVLIIVRVGSQGS